MLGRDHESRVQGQTVPQSSTTFIVGVRSNEAMSDYPFPLYNLKINGNTSPPPLLNGVVAGGGPCPVALQYRLPLRP